MTEPDAPREAPDVAAAIAKVKDYITTAMRPTNVAAACSEGLWDRGRRSGLKEALNAITDWLDPVVDAQATALAAAQQENARLRAKGTELACRSFAQSVVHDSDVARVARLTQALETYGAHRYTCQRGQNWDNPKHWPCTCGLAAALADAHAVNTEAHGSGK